MEIETEHNALNQNLNHKHRDNHKHNHAVNHPAHYTKHPSGIECIEITEHMTFNLGNAVKYLWRAGFKGPAEEDLRKAVWYIDRELKRLYPDPPPRTPDFEYIEMYVEGEGEGEGDGDMQSNT
jgi:hypothetical protein